MVISKKSLHLKYEYVLSIFSQNHGYFPLGSQKKLKRPTKFLMPQGRRFAAHECIASKMHQKYFTCLHKSESMHLQNSVIVNFCI